MMGVCSGSIKLTIRSVRVLSSSSAAFGWGRRQVGSLFLTRSFLGSSVVMQEDYLPCKVRPVEGLDNTNYSAIVIVAPSLDKVREVSHTCAELILTQAKVDKTVEKEGTLVPLNPGNLTRLIFAPVKISNDYDDVRSYAEAASKGIQRAVNAGAKDALLAVTPDNKFQNVGLVALLGALEAVYQPLQYREVCPEKAQKISEIGFFAPRVDCSRICDLAMGLESGRFVARDLGGGDPERMAAPKFAEYVENLFVDTPVSVEVIDDVKVFERLYPMFAAVNRAANAVERHRGRIIFLRYTGEGDITKTLMPVGKGITYDTGGADVKAGGIMAGMSRDKCGAANVVGFFQTLVQLKPKHLKVIGALAVCRNSIGEECYVADEIITSRAGVRMRVGNTDAEGRMAMTDLLCSLKEIALLEVNPHLMTVATLTGHCCLALGNYTAVMDNGPAKAARSSYLLQEAGERVGDMIEISTIRREDYAFVKSPNDGDADLLQCNNKASSQTPRGHQFPAAFMVLAAGLDEHGVNSARPLKYTHIDIAGSGGHVPNNPTGAGILALAAYAYGDLLKF